MSHNLQKVKVKDSKGKRSESSSNVGQTLDIVVKENKTECRFRSLEVTLAEREVAATCLSPTCWDW